MIADLSEPDSLPVGRFDCFILTQTLQDMPNVDIAIRNAWRAMAAGGTLLIAVATLRDLDPVRGGTYLRRLTRLGLERVVARTCQGAEIETRGYGNMLVGTATPIGRSTQHPTQSQIESYDARFPLVACARIRKSVG